MDIERIIADAYEDFKRDRGPLDDIDKINRLLCGHIEALKNGIVIAKLDPLDEAEVYSIARFCYGIIAVERDYYGKDANSVEQSLDETFSDRITDLRDDVYNFRWVPEELDEVINNGHIIYEEAVRKTICPDEYELSYDVDALYQKMVNAKKDLEALEYKYENKERIMKMYNDEMAEAKLDLNKAKNGGRLVSFRVADYIEASGLAIPYITPDTV